MFEKPNIYLGFTITDDGYCATAEKVKAICNYPLPKTTRQIMRFCGLVNFYCKSILKCSLVLKLLYGILRDNKQKPNSTNFLVRKAGEVFLSVKEVLSEKTVLLYPILHAAAFLATDGSNTYLHCCKSLSAATREK